MDSLFHICITRADGEPVYLKPGAHGERNFVSDVVYRVMKKLQDRDLIAEVVKRTAAKGVGLLRTTKHVQTDLQAALTEVNPLSAFEQDLTASLAEAITDLKSEVLPT